MTFKFNGAYNEKNIMPMAVVVIGDKPLIPLTYELTMNLEFESDSFSFTYTTDLLNLSAIYKEFNKLGKVLLVEVWSGFLPNKPQYLDNILKLQNPNSVITYKDYILGNFKNMLQRRWVGYVAQFEYNYTGDTTSDTTNVICNDFSVFLGSFLFEKSYKETQCRVSNIINDMNKRLQHFEFVFDKDITNKEKNYLMGYEKQFKKDGELKNKPEIKYETQNKSYFQILKEILEEIRATVVPDITNLKNNKISYLITRRRTSETLWQLQRGYHFSNATIRNGKFGGINKNDKLVIILSSKQKNKKAVSGSFPPSKEILTAQSPIGQSTYFYVVKDNMSKKDLEDLAFDYAQNISKNVITGNLKIPHAITNILPKHQLNIIDNSPFFEGRRLQGQNINFRIQSVSESFNMSGLSQQIEFEIDLNTNTLNADGSIKQIDLFPEYIIKDNKKVKSPFVRPVIQDLPNPLQKIRMGNII